ncbi:MAG TPA: P-loop NTPase fold protein, partial [Thiolinea sp.]|nr:P-loop NTPase fold protein [Thiolinea sp.]
MIKIIIAITSEIQAKDPSKSNTEKVIKATKGLLERVARAGAAVSLGTMGAGENSIHIINDFLEKKESSVSDLRKALQAIVNNICSGDNSSYKRVVIFVDDLDRLDPVYAVQILELLKNIFGLSNCIFLLAIDYQVVVKGLKNKFGEMNDANEWEFRAF